MKYIGMLLILVVAAFAAHYLVLSNMDVSGYWDRSGYSLEGLYAFTGIASLLMTIFILMAQWSMPKNLGMIFLGLMTIKAIASYIYIQKGLGKFDDNFIEYNFLVVFFMFLFFDVFIAFRVLNQGDNGE